MVLVAEDHTPFSKEVPLTIGMKMEDTILEALKEGEIEKLDSIWKRVKNNWSLSKLLEEVEIREAVVWVAPIHCPLNSTQTGQRFVSMRHSISAFKEVVGWRQSCSGPGPPTSEHNHHHHSEG